MRAGTEVHMPSLDVLSLQMVEVLGPQARRWVLHVDVPRTIATRSRRCENQSSCPSSLLRTRGHRDSKALVKTEVEDSDSQETQCDELRQLVDAQLQAELKGER